MHGLVQKLRYIDLYEEYACFCVSYLYLLVRLKSSSYSSLLFLFSIENVILFIFEVVVDHFERCPVLGRLVYCSFVQYDNNRLDENKNDRRVL